MHTALRLFEDRQGAAFGEAAVVLPVMAVCWAALHFHTAGYTSAMDAASQARFEALRVSATACQAEQRGDDTALVRASVPAQAQGAVQQALCAVPLVSSTIRTAIGDAATVRTFGVSFRAPPLLGGGTYGTHSSYHVLCNEAEPEKEAATRSTLCSALTGLHSDLESGLDCSRESTREGDGVCR